MPTKPVLRPGKRTGRVAGNADLRESDQEFLRLVGLQVGTLGNAWVTPHGRGPAEVLASARSALDQAKGMNDEERARHLEGWWNALNRKRFPPDANERRQPRRDLQDYQDAIRENCPADLQPIIVGANEPPPEVPAGAVVYYARVSTEEQADRDSILTQLNDCKHPPRGVPKASAIIVEVASGADDARPGLRALLESRPAAVVVARVDRLARSALMAFVALDHFLGAGIPLHISNLSIDVTTSSGRLMFGILSVLAEWERDIISERTRDSLKRMGGKSKTSTQLRANIVAWRNEGYSWNQVRSMVATNHHRSLARSTVRFIYETETAKIANKAKSGDG